MQKPFSALGLFSLAVSICIVAIEWPVQGEGKAALFVNGITRHLDLKTSFRSAAGRTLKDVVVFNPRPNISVGCSGSNFLQLSDGEFKLLAVHDGAWTNHSTGGLPVVRKVEVSGERSGFLPDPHVDVAHHILCGSLTAVLPNGKKCPFEDCLSGFLGGPKRFDVLGENVSSQLPLSVVLGVVHQIPGSPEQRDGGEKEKKSKSHEKRVSNFEISNSEASLAPCWDCSSPSFSVAELDCLCPATPSPPGSAWWLVLGWAFKALLGCCSDLMLGVCGVGLDDSANAPPDNVINKSITAYSLRTVNVLQNILFKR